MIRSITAAVLTAVLMISSIGCGQDTIATLTATLGNAAAQVAIIQGNTALAAQLTADTNAAVAAVKNWKKGTPAENAIQALGIVESDLNLIMSQLPPQAQGYTALISLAIITTESILALLPKGNAPPTESDVVAARAVYSRNVAPKNAAEFKRQWNDIVAANPEARQATIK